MRPDSKSDFLDKVSDKQAAVIFDVVFGNSAERVSEILERRGVSQNEYHNNSLSISSIGEIEGASCIIQV